MKRLFAIALTVVMIMALAVPAMAADPTYDLTINSTDNGHIYEAYQIFAGTLSSDGTTLSNCTWGSGIKAGMGDTLLAALLSDTKPIPLTGGATTTLQTVFASAAAMATTEQQFDEMVKLLGTVSNDSSTLDRFAEIVGHATYDVDGKFIAHTYLNTPAATDDYADSQYKLTVPAGYYLVKDKEGSQEGQDDYYTKYIIRVVQDGMVNPKGSGVIVDKTINDTLDGTYDDIEDFDINDTAYFKWVGTMPSNLRAYDDYWYKFTDKLPVSLTFEKLEAVYIENHSGVMVHEFYNASVPSTLPAGITASYDETNRIYVMEFTDLLTLYPSILSTDKVVVKYSAKVNRDMAIALPNTNEVYLEYDNNPNGEGHGKTLPDVAHAFTFAFTVDKFDQADPSKKLEGVEFKMYYRTVNAMSEIIKMYAQVVTEEMIAAHTPINGKVVDSDDLGMVYGWTENEADASVLDTDANGHFYVKGLDEGTYFLEETKTVDGYNLLDTPVQIDIIPTYTETGDTASVTVEYRVDSISQGDNVTVGIRNSKGSTLPSTGGVGTTLFYILGGFMVVGAAVLLVTKKRMAA